MTIRQRVARLKDNWIDIEKHETGVWIVIDTRYSVSQPTFEFLKDAIEYGERQVGLR